MINKKIAAIGLSALMLSTLCACGENSGISSGEGGGLFGSLTLRVFDGGYGTEVWKDLATAYQRQNRGVTVSVRPTVDTLSDLDKVKAKLYIGDLFVHTTNVNSNGIKGEFLDLSDVYSSIPTGESKSIEEKLGASADFFEVYNGARYAMPVADGVTGLVYNKTALESALGKDNYSIPNTTDELLALCNRIQSVSGYYPFVYSIDTNAEYQWWMTYYFVSQLMGVEAFNKGYEGMYYDSASEEYIFDYTGEYIYNLPQKREAIADTQRFNSNLMGMASPNCKSMDFAEAQAYFLGYGYGINDKGKSVFMTNGDWVYNEMEYLIDDNHPQEICMMKMPVCSALKNYCDSIEDDAELSSLIAAVDAGSEALSGNGYSVTQNDFDRVKEARSIIYTLTSQQLICMPYNCKNTVLAKDFLKFMASDTGCAIFSRALHGDVSPYNRSVEGVTPNSFIQSKIDILGKNYTMVSSLPSTGRFNFDYFASYFYYSKNLHENKALEEFNQNTYKTAFLTRYTDAVTAAGLNEQKK